MTFSQRWKQTALHNQAMVIGTIVIAVATVIYSIFAGWQLYEIHTGSVDTHAMAEAVKIQSEVAMQALHGSHRPWVAVSDPIAVNSPLTLKSQISPDTAELNASFYMKNVGASPAFNVVVITSLTTIPLVSFVMQAKSQCDNELTVIALKSLMERRLGTMILPNDGVQKKGKVVSKDIRDQARKTSVWLNVCIGYSDEFNSFHMTGQSLQFQNNLGEFLFDPVGIIYGTIQPHGISGMAN